MSTSLKVTLRTKPRPTLCDRRSRQLSGTCWFHAIINGFLLSNVGRALMRKQLYEYKLKHNIPLKNANTCALYGNLPMGSVMFYLDFFFSYRIRPYGNSSAIQNLRPQGNIVAGDSSDIVKVIRGIFGKGSVYHPQAQNHIYGKSDVAREKMKPKFYVFYTTGPHFDKLVQNSQLVFINITAKGKPSHVITGITCGNTNYIYDSNYKRLVKLDWTSTNREELLRQYFTSKKTYSYLGPTPNFEYDYVYRLLKN